MKTATFVMIALILVAPSVAGGDGRILITEPMTITEPGSYLVGADLTPVDGPALIIDAGDVTVDLGGHTLNGMLELEAFFNIQDKTPRPVRIHNGRVDEVRGWYDSSGYLVDIEAVEAGSIQLQGNFSRFGLRNSIVGTLFVNDGDGGGGTVRVIDNFLGSVVLSPVRSAVIQGNTISGSTSLSQEFNGRSDRVMVIDNNCGDITIGQGMNGINKGLVVRGNEVAGSIEVYNLHSAQIVGNTVLPDDEPGIYVHSSTQSEEDSIGVYIGHNTVVDGQSDGVRLQWGRNHVLNDNQLIGNAGCGVSANQSQAAVLRDNILTGNLGGATCGGSFVNGGSNLRRPRS